MLRARRATTMDHMRFHKLKTRLAPANARLARERVAVRCGERVWLAILACLAIDAGRLFASATPIQKPNVLVIVVDDLNDWIGPLGGHPQVKTPHMDRLARQGVAFVNAHCQSPLCNPSRTSVMTGLRPSTTGVYALEPWFRTDVRFRDLVTLPQYFARHGYTTLSCGKVYHDAYPPPAGRRNGVEFSVWGEHGRMRNRPPKRLTQLPDAHPLVDWGPFPDRDEETFDWDVTDWAVRQLASPPAGLWLLFVGIRHPHVPCFTPQKWFDLYSINQLVMPPIKEDDRLDTPGFSWYLHWKLPEPRLSVLVQRNEWRSLVRAYLASVSFADAMVGRVLDALDANGQSNRTVVVLWSDHGWHLGEKGITGKNSLWERSTRVPLIFAGPGIVRSGRCDRPAELLDLYPTLVELCGLPAKSDIEGHSLVPLLSDPSCERRWPAITTHNPNNHAVRGQQWRYIRYADGSQELYDLASDPNEWRNLAGDPHFADIQREHANWLPVHNADLMPGSRHRDLVYRDNAAIWEGKIIDPNDRQP